MVTSKDIMKRAMRLKDMKSQDYQGSNFREDEYFPFKDQSYAHMIWTKTLRMMNIINVMHPNYESLEDTLLDLINYSAMYAAHIENEKTNKEKQKELWTGEQLPEPQQQSHELWQIQKDRT